MEVQEGLEVMIGASATLLLLLLLAPIVELFPAEVALRSHLSLVATVIVTVVVSSLPMLGKVRWLLSVQPPPFLTQPSVPLPQHHHS